VEGALAKKVQWVKAINVVTDRVSSRTAVAQIVIALVDASRQGSQMPDADTIAVTCCAAALFAGRCKHRVRTFARRSITTDNSVRPGGSDEHDV